MLEHTFIHLPSFGHKREKKLWHEGVCTWHDFLDRFGSSRFHKSYCSHLASSAYALKQKDARYFSNSIPSNELWRCFPHFEDVAYVDIETTGLSAEKNDLTVIGLFDGDKTYSYVCEQNLDQFPEDIEKYDAIVTFNGSLFDVPFIKKSFDSIKVPPIHVDLRFVLTSLGIKGGLKKIEQAFGLEREDDLKGLNGYDAVLLWKKYKKRNDKDALDKLVRYNAADVSNLKTLMEWAYNKKREATGFDEVYRKKVE